MNGFTEDLLNLMAREITKNWEKKGRNLSYFVNMVKSTPLTPADLDKFLDEQGDTCPECVNHVFAAIVYDDLMKKEGGDK